AVRIAVEEAADLVFELAHALDRDRDQRPGEFLMGQPFAALDRVHEVPLDRVAGIDRNVVTALHHARAAALTEEPLARNRHAPAPRPGAPLRRSRGRCRDVWPRARHGNTTAATARRPSTASTSPKKTAQASTLRS